MNTRAYDNESRRRRYAERKAGIAAATVELHAKKGVLATSYADIARHAKVSVPTVYSHFPTQNDLLKGCTGHVAATAPPFPAEKILAAPDLPTAAKLLVAAIEQQHLHFEPWLVWREDQVVPYLAQMVAGMRQANADLVASLLSRHKVPGRRGALVAAWESLLSFDLWHRMVREHRISCPATRRILVQCLLALIGPKPAGKSKNSPRSKT